MSIIDRSQAIKDLVSLVVSVIPSIVELIKEILLAIREVRNG